MPVAAGETIDLERTRAKLLRAATELFYRDGVAASVDDIARRAATSKLTYVTSATRTACSKRFCGSAATASLRGSAPRRTGRPIRWTSFWPCSTPCTAGMANTSFVAARLSTPPPELSGQGRAGSPDRGRASGAAARPPSPPRRASRRVQNPDLAGRQLLIMLEGATAVAAITRDERAATDARALIAGVVGGR